MQQMGSTLSVSMAANVTHPHGRRGNTQIYGIDLLRFLAAVLVVVYHTTFTIWAAPYSTSPTSTFSAFYPLAPFTSCGWIGVEIFFVISGYVIVYTAEGRTPTAFLNSRVLRLLPGIVLCASLTLPALLYLHISSGTIIRDFVGSILLFPVGPWLSGVYWTLPVEVAFYSVIFLLLLTKRFGDLELVIYILGVISTLAWIAFYLRPPTGPVSTVFFWLGNNRVAQLLLIHHGVFFALGTILRLVHSQGASLRRLLAISIFCAAALSEIVATASGTSKYMNQPVSALLPCLIWLGTMALMIVSLRHNDFIAHRLGAWRPIVRAMGLATFPLYLLHEQISFALIAEAIRRGASPFLGLFIAWAGVGALAFLVAMVLEPVLRIALRRILLASEGAIWPAAAASTGVE